MYEDARFGGKKPDKEIKNIFDEVIRKGK